jgi:DNA methylase
MAMFPPAIPHLFIRWLTKPGDAVYDPFSGRGTTILEACLAGRVGLASDANPLAWLLSRAKCDPPMRASLATRLRQLAESEPGGLKVNAPADIEMLFAPRVLSQLIWLQTELDRSRRVDRFLLAALAGMLHGNADRAGVPRGLSIAMPNTFAMAPQYVRRYIKEHDLKPPVVDVLDALARRLNTFPLPGEGFRRGQAWLQDVTSRIAYPKDAPQAKLVFTSPPYLQVIKYGKFNWVRHWLLQSDPRECFTRQIPLIHRSDGSQCQSGDEGRWLLLYGRGRRSAGRRRTQFGAPDRENVLRGHRSAGYDNHQRLSASATQGQSYLGRNTWAGDTCGPNYHRARSQGETAFST